MLIYNKFIKFSFLYRIFFQYKLLLISVETFDRNQDNLQVTKEQLLYFRQGSDVANIDQLLLRPGDIQFILLDLPKTKKAASQKAAFFLCAMYVFLIITKGICRKKIL